MTIHPAIVDGDHVYAQGENGVVAFDALESTVAVAHGLVYVVTSDGYLHAVDATTGKGTTR